MLSEHDKGHLGEYFGKQADVVAAFLFGPLPGATTGQAVTSTSQFCLIAQRHLRLFVPRR